MLVMARQALGAVPVPVYADAVANELAYVLAHAEVRFAAVEDQEQVDKILSVSERLPKLETDGLRRARGLRDYDHANLHAIDEVIADGRSALEADAEPRRWLDAEIAAGKAPTPRSSSTRPAPPAIEGRGAVGRGCIARLRHGALRQAHRRTRRWPICRSPGSATTISTTRRLVAASAWPARRAARPRCRICARSVRPSTSHRRAPSRPC
jgi:hypothetical protein